MSWNPKIAFSSAAPGPRYGHCHVPYSGAWWDDKFQASTFKVPVDRTEQDDAARGRYLLSLAIRRLLSSGKAFEDFTDIERAKYHQWLATQNS